VYSYLHHPSRLGLATALAAGVAVLLLCAIFQFVVPAHDVSAYVPANPGNVNLRALILYAAAGGAHVLLCSLGTAILFFRVRVAEPNFRKITVDFTIAFSVIIAVVVLGCYLNLRVVQQSYFETIQPLQGDPRFGHLLGEHRIPLIAARFQLFAIFPLVLIAFGAAIAIVACFWVSQRMVDFVRTADGLKEAEIMEMKRDVAQLVSMISAIFTTSTVSTIALLQLGRDWIEKGPSRDAYIGRVIAESW